MKKQLTTLALATLILSPLAHAKTTKCAFGDDLDALAANKRFTSAGKGMYTFKRSRISSGATRLLWVEVTQITDTKTKREYQVNTTHDDAYDGGNTIGWIEDVTNARDGVQDGRPSRIKGTGEMVASIGDSSIFCEKNFE